jgi:hypothetical protein
VAGHLDTRIKAGIDIDDTPSSDRATWKVTFPVMLLQSHGLSGDRQAAGFYESLRTGYLAVIHGAQHRGLSDEA